MLMRRPGSGVGRDPAACAVLARMRTPRGGNIASPVLQFSIPPQLRAGKRSPVPYSDRISGSEFSNSQLDAQVQTHRHRTIFAATPASRAGTPRAHYSISPADPRWLLYLAVGAALLLRLLSACLVDSPVDGGQTVEAARNSIFLPPSGALEPRVASPVNIGSGILLPADYSSWTEKLRVVLATRFHVRQRDFYLQCWLGSTPPHLVQPVGWWLNATL